MLDPLFLRWTLPAHYSIMSPISPQTDAASDAKHRALALRWFEEIWNECREQTIHELCSPDLIGSMEGVDGVITKDGFVAYWHAMRTAISDLHVEVKHVTADGPNTTVRWRLTGQHTGPGLGVPPSGRRVDFRGLTWFEFEDGMVVRGGDRWNRGEGIASLMAPRISELQDRYGLTPREAQVALLLAERRTAKEIARDLEIRPNTARRHCAKVLAKMGLHRKEEVAAALGVTPGAALLPHGSDLA